MTYVFDMLHTFSGTLLMDHMGDPSTQLKILSISSKFEI